MITAVACPSSAGSSGSGCFRLSTTVSGSGVAIAAMLAKTRRSLFCPPGAAEASNLAFTAAASSSVPSWKRTPGRSTKVQVLRSGEALQRSASSGWALPSSATFVRGSSTL